MKHYTSISQSKKLLELGLSPETADMYYMETSYNSYTIGVLQRMEKDMLLSQAEYYKMFPCWSLGELLEVMPEQITYSDFKSFPLGLFKGNKEEHSKYGHYWIQYFATDSGGAHVQTNGHSPIEAAYSMVVWLLENGFIKKESKTSNK